VMRAHLLHAFRRAHQSERQVLRRTWRPRRRPFVRREVRLPFRSEMVSCRMQGPALSGLMSWCDGRAYDVIAPAFSLGAVVGPLLSVSAPLGVCHVPRTTWRVSEPASVHQALCGGEAQAARGATD
jgi:hypothetical protein